MSTADTEIRDAIRDALRREALGASDVRVEVEGGVVTFTGWVDEAWMIGRAETVARTLARGATVHDELRVRSELGVESEAKRTEFGSADASRAATGEEL